MLHNSCVYHLPVKENADSTRMAPRDMLKAMKILRYVAKESMKETAFGRKMAKDIYPVISTDLIVICDFWERILNRRS